MDVESNHARGRDKYRLANLKLNVSNAVRFHCEAANINTNLDQHRQMMDFLPKGYQYHVCRCKAVGHSCGGFEAMVRMGLQSKEEVLLWLKSMPVTWRVLCTRPTKGRKTIFRTDYRCQHNTRTAPKPGRVSKNTRCPAKLKVTLMRAVDSCGKPSRSTDPHLPTYPTLVEISNIHNHNLQGSHDGADENLSKLTEADEPPTTAHTAAAEAVLCREELQSKVREFSDTLLSDEALVGGASAMMRTFERLKGNPSALLLALHAFGRHDATALPVPRPAHRATAPGRASVLGHRKVKLEVRGRPRENVASCTDHHYSHPVGASATSVEVCHSNPES
ncbi:uncharacterized protein LOC142887818 [Nelusetta ayraudi]|uniref:uncharacterized protein LOC142887818 n=1 Tax=Nelusetta ayraudi TaxID=303726 RepID=UPI003F702C43